MAFKMKGYTYPGKTMAKQITQFLLQKKSGLGPRAKREDDQSRIASIVESEQGSKKPKDPYYYKIDGKNVSKQAYLDYENKPGQMEGGGKTTNNPDVYGRKSKK